MVVLEAASFYPLLALRLHCLSRFQPEKVTVVFPMRYKDGNDVVLATSFLQVNVTFFVSNR